MTKSPSVSFYGAGGIGTAAAHLLAERGRMTVTGPFRRSDRDEALRSGADVVVIATTSYLPDIGDDVRDAVEAGSNVITTAEEAAFPWCRDPDLAQELDAHARNRGVTILGAGLNPGFAFDALVLTLLGATPAVESIRVSRAVDLSGWSETVLHRLGVGHTRDSFQEQVRAGRISGHIGFPESMSIVGSALGVAIDSTHNDIKPMFAAQEIRTTHLTIRKGDTAGFRQECIALVNGRRWFETSFTGHVRPSLESITTGDHITIDGPSPIRVSVASPGFNPQSGTASIIANSIARVIQARPGWLTVADLQPAVPA